ncbi:hypothetical protein ACFX1X_004887 [Malus domestica]
MSVVASPTLFPNLSFLSFISFFLYVVLIVLGVSSFGFDIVLFVIDLKIFANVLQVEWRIHSGVNGVARPLGSHGNNLRDPLELLVRPLGVAGETPWLHTKCSTKVH